MADSESRVSARFMLEHTPYMARLLTWPEGEEVMTVTLSKASSDSKSECPCPTCDEPTSPGWWCVWFFSAPVAALLLSPLVVWLILHWVR